MKKTLALLSIVFLFLLLMILYFIKPQKTGEVVKILEDEAERVNINKKWHLIGKISIEDGNIVNVTHFENIE